MNKKQKLPWFLFRREGLHGGAKSKTVYIFEICIGRKDSGFFEDHSVIIRKLYVFITWVKWRVKGRKIDFLEFLTVSIDKKLKQHAHLEMWVDYGRNINE